jgi:purine nucleoside permease
MCLVAVVWAGNPPTLRRNLGLIAQVRFNELELLARSRSLFAEANATRTERNTYSSGRYWNGANQIGLLCIIYFVAMP